MSFEGSVIGSIAALCGMMIMALLRCTAPSTAALNDCYFASTCVCSRPPGSSLCINKTDMSPMCCLGASKCCSFALLNLNASSWRGDNTDQGLEVNMFLSSLLTSKLQCTESRKLETNLKLLSSSRPKVFFVSSLCSRST